MLNDFLANIEIIQKARDLNKLVIFAGAGISVDSGVPLWSILIKVMTDKLNLPNDETDYLKIAQLYYNQRGQKEFVDVIRETLRYKQTRYNDIHETLFELKPQHIITTNFDDLLEQVVQSKAHPFSVITKDSEFPYATSSYLIKMHGDLNETDFILKEDDFLDYNTKHPLFEAFIKSVFATKVVLFIGYSFSDWDLKLIINSVRNILGKDFQKAFLLNIDIDFPLSQRDYLKNKGITVINYDDCKDSNEIHFVDPYLAKRNYSTKEGDFNKIHLSEPGKKLKRLLDFITIYNPFQQKLSDSSTLEAIDQSLKRFDELSCLPLDFISNLFPFNNGEDDYIYTHSPFTIVSNNKNVLELFKSYLVADNEMYKLKDGLVNNRNASGAELLFVKIIRKLNSSGAFYIEFETDVWDDFAPNYGSIINIRMPISEEESLLNIYENFQFDIFFSKLKSGIITYNSDEQNDMEIAYSYYKLGKFAKAFDLFEEIGAKAWQKGKFITYFICQSNKKTLKNLIETIEEKPANKNFYKEKILKIELDKSILQIPAINSDVYSLLQEIRDYRYAKEIDNDVQKSFNSVYNVYHTYKNKIGMISNAGEAEKIGSSLFKLYIFYTYNNIILDEYTDFTSIIQKGIEGFVLESLIEKGYRRNNPGINLFLFSVTIKYCDFEKLIKSINHSENFKLDIHPESLGKVVEFTINLFRSSFKTNRFNNKIEATEITNELVTSTRFVDNYRKYVVNCFQFYQYVELDENSFQKIIIEAIKFLEIEDVLYFNDWNIVFKLFKSKARFFKQPQIDKLIELSFIKDAWLQSTYFFPFLSDCFHNQETPKSINQELLEELYKHFSNKNKSLQNFDLMIIYSLAKSPSKIKLEKIY